MIFQETWPEIVARKKWQTRRPAKRGDHARMFNRRADRLFNLEVPDLLENWTHIWDDPDNWQLWSVCNAARNIRFRPDVKYRVQPGRGQPSLRWTAADYAGRRWKAVDVSASWQEAKRKGFDPQQRLAAHYGPPVCILSTRIRLERLHDITLMDMLAEGLTMEEAQTGGFEALWSRVYSPDSAAAWTKNPAVWVIKFVLLDIEDRRLPPVYEFERD